MKYYDMNNDLAFDVCREYISQISAVRVCLEQGNSHDADFQYCNLVLQKDFVIPEEWNKRSTYVAVPIVEYCDSTDADEKKRAFLEHLKKNQETSFTVYTNDSMRDLEDLAESYQTIGDIKYYEMACELSESRYGLYLRLIDYKREQEAINKGFCKISAFSYYKPLYDYVLTERAGQYYLCSDKQKRLNSPEVFEILPYSWWIRYGEEKNNKHFMRY